MDVNAFILAHQEEWEELGHLLAMKKRDYHDTRRLGELYRSTAEHLSFARTRFPEHEIVAWLNSLVRDCHLVLFKQQGSRWNEFLRFYSTVFPSLTARLWKPILISLFVFTSCVVLSLLMSKNDIKKAEMFLHQKVYEMALQDLDERKQFGNFDNIERSDRPLISLYIWYNNSMVSLLCLVMGITFGIGTFSILVLNGLMLGGLATFYWLNGSFVDFFSLIMIHGSIELPAIILAGGAGFHIASAILFPGRHSRKALLKKNAQESILMLAGIVSLLCLAGLIEGFVTPAKPSVTIRIIIASANLVWLTLYFIHGARIMRKDTSSQSPA